jgi:beta-lactamase regulating signal transducer with metallopeptidase domain
MNDFLQALLKLTNEGGRFLLLWSWQVCLLLGFVYLLLKLCRFRAATIRHQLWSIALLAVVLLPLCSILAEANFAPRQQGLPVDFIVDVPANFLASQELAATESSKPIPKSDAFTLPSKDFLSLFFLVWVAGFLIAAKRLWDSYRHSRKLRSLGRAVSLAELECADLQHRLVRSNVIEIKLAEGIVSPVLLGFLHPTILLPADLMQWTTVEERETILLHEMIHAQRRDHWANYFQSLVQVALFFHPLVRYASNQLSMERELSCDEKVLISGVQASSYVESILKVAEKSIASDVLHQPAFITKKMLERRIEMILKGEHLKWSAKRWTLLILPVALIALMLWVLIPRGSASAQSSKETLEKHRAEEREKMEREKKSRETELQEKEIAVEIEIPKGEKGFMQQELEVKQALQGAEILAQVSELRLIYGKRHEAADNLIDVTAAETATIGEEVKLSNVVVKTPEFTFKAEHAARHKDILNLIGTPIEVECQGRVYYSYNSIAIANRSGMIMYVISKHAKLYTEKNQLGESVEFGKLLSEAQVTPR